MSGFRFALVSPMGTALGTVELMVPMVQPGETVIASDRRRLLVLDVVDLSDRDGDVRAISRLKSSRPRRERKGRGRLRGRAARDQGA